MGLFGKRRKAGLMLMLLAVPLLCSHFTFEFLLYHFIWSCDCSGSSSPSQFNKTYLLQYLFIILLIEDLSWWWKSISILCYRYTFLVLAFKLSLPTDITKIFYCIIFQIFDYLKEQKLNRINYDFHCRHIVNVQKN